ncbi:acyltransferase family protein [Paenibacillus chitinolyticus]|uniref:acyltransferase family protein n=1 Tax=Paenibacillus chitinolyticus TaxID=79263 RepID=UPI0036735297
MLGKKISGILGMDRYVHIPELDGIRAIAVLMVFIYHAWGNSGIPKLNIFGWDITFLLSWGHPGVNLFYVLSGFLLFIPFANYYYNANKCVIQPSLKKYFIRRALRILPVYYVFLVLNILLTNNVTILSTEGVKKLFINIFFLQGFFPEHMINGVTWTLSNEVQFYILLPFIARYFIGRRALIAFPATLALVIIYRIVCFFIYTPNIDSIDWKYYYLTEYNILGCIDNFTIGMTISSIFYYKKIGKNRHIDNLIISARYLTWLTPLFFGMLFYTYYSWRFKQNSHFSWFFFSFGFDFFLYILFALIFLYVLFHKSLLTTFLSNTYLRIIGVIGYSVYIWHLPLMDSLNKTNFINSAEGWGKFYRLIPFSLLVILPFSFFMFILVEKYFIDLSSSLTKKHEDGMASAKPVKNKITF